MPLPAEKTPVALSATTAKVLLYGVPKVGKSTLASGIDPDHTLFLACEPGLGGLNVYQEPVTSWEDFRRVCGELKSDTHTFTTIVVDPLENLAMYCQDFTMKELGASHPSDLEWGKGWKAVSDNFKRGVGFLSSLGLGVWFIDHAKDEEIKQRVGTITKAMPTTGGAARKFILGFVDHIFYATIVQTEDGPQHVLRTRPSENWEAGTRIQGGVPDPLPMDPGKVILALSAHEPIVTAA